METLDAVHDEYGQKAASLLFGLKLRYLYLELLNLSKLLTDEAFYHLR